MLNPRLLLVVLAAMIAAPAWATVPQALSFQGYLTDRVGSPIVDSQTITFSIYVVPVGGVPVWQETKSVAFSNGLFSTRLGELTSFPSDLFDVPLWISMTVGSDSEMEPRRSLTSAGFSFRAEDSDTLQGQSAAELDQSGHVDDLSNPHAVSPAQTGAATQAGLDAHATDSSNPHAVSAGQTGGTPAGVFNVHAADGSAHHARYADAEAVTSMGAQSASNPLNHQRYGDSEAVGAVLAADGDGSGLDSDLVDGLEATEIINAAAGAVGGTRYEYVGNSENTVAGNVGLLGMTNECKSTFGPTAKFATSKEIIETTTFSLQSGDAWAQPHIIDAFGTGSTRILVDISGIVAGSGSSRVSMNCEGWSLNTSPSGVVGLHITSEISLNQANCASVKHVACSTPTNGPTR